MIRLGAGSASLVAVLVGCGPESPPSGNFPPIDSADGGLSDGADTDAFDANLPDEPVSPDGTWLMWWETSACFKVGRTGLQSLTGTSAVVEMTDEGNGVVRHVVRTCHIEQTPILGVPTTIPDRVAESIPPREFLGFLYGSRSGATYETQLSVELWGIRLTDPYNEALPGAADDPRVFDQDEDNNPGVTLLLGSDPCEMHVIQRGFTQWKGTVLSGTRIEGGGVSTSRQIRLGSTGGFCATSFETTFPEADGRFALLRVDGQHGAIDLDTDADGAVSCDELRAYGLAGVTPRQPDQAVCRVEEEE